MKKWVKITLVVVGALIVTALGIDAADTLTGSGGTLLSQVIQKDGGLCPKGMSSVSNVSGVNCVDTFEVSIGSECPLKNPKNIPDSLENLEVSACKPESKPDSEPWRFITRDQAMQACARAGKRLPTSEEWYGLALGLTNVDASCNLSSGKLEQTGAKGECVSPAGAYDMVGNVWEWVLDDVVEGKHNDVVLAPSGYVAQVNQGGMAVMSTSTEFDLFGKDYFWSRSDGAYGIIRGGYYDSGSDGGIYTVHADTPPTTAGTAIGFRCVL